MLDENETVDRYERSQLLELLPVVRDVRALGTINFDTDHDVVAVFGDGVVVYRRSGGNEVPAEAFFATTRGSLDDAKAKGALTSLAWSEVKCVRVSERRLVGSRLLTGLERGRWLRIVDRRDRYAEVFLPELDAKIPIAVLREVVPSVEEGGGPDTWTDGERLSASPRSTLLRLLTVSTCVAVVATIAVRAAGPSALALMIVGGPASLIATIGWPVVVLGSLLRPPTRLAKEERRARASPQTGRQPMQSVPMGNLLKLGAGVLALAAMAIQMALLEHPKQFPRSDLWSWLTLLPAGVAAHYGHRLSMKSGEDRLREDPRPPILYLRSFVHDDKGTYNPDTWLSRILGCKPFLNHALGPAANPLLPNIVRMILGRATEVAEEQFAAGLRDVGPVVAIGRPGERIAAGGAARLYVGDDGWKEVVRELIDTAQLVVAEAGGGENLWWEIEQVCQSDRDRLVLSFRGMQEDQAVYDDFRLRFASEQGVALSPCVRGLLFIAFRGDRSYYVPKFQHPPVLWPVEGCAVNFARVFDYINKLRSGAVAPTEPERVSFWSGAFAFIVWNVFGGVVLWAIGSGINTLLEDAL